MTTTYRSEGDPNGRGVTLWCTDMQRDDYVERQVRISVDGEMTGLVFYDEPTFKEDATIELALMNLAVALGARVTCVKTTLREDENV